MPKNSAPIVSAAKIRHDDDQADSHNSFLEPVPAPEKLAVSELMGARSVGLGVAIAANIAAVAVVDGVAIAARGIARLLR